MNRLTRLSLLPVIGALMVNAPAQLLKSSHASTMPVPRTTSVAVPKGGIVARVNGVEITRAAFEQELRRIFPYFSMHGNAIPKEYEADIRNKALNNLVNEELFYQEAKRRNLQITPAEWRKRLAEVQKDYPSKSEFEKDVARLFGTREAFENKLRHDMLLDKLYLTEVKHKAVVSEADIQKDYAAKKAGYIQPESVQFQSITMSWPKSASPAQKETSRKRIEEALPKAKAAQNYEQFGVLAEKISEDDYRVMMGDHRMSHRGQLPPDIEKFVFAMKEGETSGIFQSTTGYHIFRLNKHFPGKQLSYAEMHDSIKVRLQKERTAERSKAFNAALRQKAKVEIL